jgi:hypothetical protein
LYLNNQLRVIISIYIPTKPPIIYKTALLSESVEVVRVVGTIVVVLTGSEYVFTGNKQIIHVKVFRIIILNIVVQK